MNINEVNELCMKRYGDGITIEKKVAELIQPYLDKKKKDKILEDNLHICIYHISDELNEMIFSAPYDINEEKLYEMIRVCVSNEVKTNWYVEPPKKKNKLYEAINKALEQNELDDQDDELLLPPNFYGD